ncbi:hypothetical protein BGZ74_007741 [Mortierella antarctica]|nr:hypothetical protein BGZ74_007741 [Mortierella antarctica]
MAQNNKGYIRIEEDCPPAPAFPARTENCNAPKAKTANLRNVAMTPAVYAKSPKGILRVNVLDTIMPLSRTPWTNAQSVVKPTNKISN